MLNALQQWSIFRDMAVKNVVDACPILRVETLGHRPRRERPQQHQRRHDFKDEVKDDHGAVVREDVVVVLQMVEPYLHPVAVEAVCQAPQRPCKEHGEVKADERFDAGELREA